MHKYIWIAADAKTNKPIFTAFQKDKLISHLNNYFSFGGTYTPTVSKYSHLHEDEYDCTLIYTLKYETTINSTIFENIIKIFCVEILQFEN
jgi:hypothetical protein